MANFTVNRESLITSLEDRYAKQRAGSAYHVQQDLVTEGTNEKAIGTSYNDINFTIHKGFKIKQQEMMTEFKEAANDLESLQLSRFMRGFDNRRYY